jgi:hypothetical protein
MPEGKMVVAFESDFALMVVSERQLTDTLNIRVTQGLEIVRKYMAERYRQLSSKDVEKSYVPGA